MTIATPVPWPELLSRRFTNVNDEYGPNSQAVASALMILGDARWLERVGEPWTESALESQSATLTVVKSWEDAPTIFDEFPRYNINGVLQAPCDRVDPIFDRMPDRQAWWEKAREDAKRYTALYGWVPDSLSRDHQELLFEHLYEFVSMLLAEIIASPEAECTYFREQLTWFHAGHFPCGWDGDWPSGRMRVF
jgi:hypothetical protein